MGEPDLHNNFNNCRFFAEAIRGHYWTRKLWLVEFSMLETPSVTSTQMGQATAVAAFLDAIVIGILWWRVPRNRFVQLRKWLPCIAGATWMLIYGVASLAAWESCYRYVMPTWVRWGAWLYGLSHILLGFLFWWIAKGMPMHPVITLAALGGLHSLPGHLWGIYGLGLLERCPLIRDVSPISALAFGVFEFAFYWIWVLVLALSLRWLTAKVYASMRDRVRRFSRA